MLPFAPEPVDSEFVDVNLGDARLDARLVKLVTALAMAPAASLPAVSTAAELEGTYRFLGNERVLPANILAPHIAATWRRAAAANGAGLDVLSVEDTTEMRFGGKHRRDGLGMVTNGGQGFFLHPALLVASGPTPVPLGVADYELAIREKPRENRDDWEATRVDPNRESLRWGRVASAVDSAAAPHGLKVIHVADREADDYEYLGPLSEAGSRFVVRLTKNRNVKMTAEGRLVSVRDHVHMDEAMASATGVLEREVPLSRRVHARSRGRTAKNARRERVAKLVFRAARLQLLPPKVGQCKTAITLNVVDVVEENPPEGEQPIHWRLATTEPIDTAEQIARVVDMYRARWLVEEYFKALKTGCSMEDRQLEALAGLHKLLAVLIPIAWHMLLMRTVARHEPDTPAPAVLTARQMAALRTIAETPVLNRRGVRLPQAPTARDALAAVALLGGHIKNNGDPGWIVLRRGLTELARLLPVLELVRAGSDQS